MASTRRHFVKGLSLAAVAAALPLRGADKRLPIAFSTLACPQWDWTKILDYAAAHEFAAIELRGLQGNLDLPSHRVFDASQITQTERDIIAHGLRIACVSSSAHMDECEEAARAKQSSDAKRCIDLAAALHAPYVRVFGTNPGSGNPLVLDDQVKSRVAANLKEVGEYAGTRGVTVLIESHDNLVTSPVLSDVLQRANSKHVALLWDAYHTFAEGGEQPEFTVAQLGKWIRHTHLKDSVITSDGRKYVLTGQGDVPIRRQIRALQRIGYQGYFCFEWEKVWHPDLTDPEIAVADYARVISGYLRETT
ncbi:MAG: sugar phosphate isomerase/epimerase family protein [Candidatus Acidiferrum sp.]